MTEVAEYGSKEKLRNMIQDEVAMVRTKFEENYKEQFPGNDPTIGSYYGNIFIRDLKIKQDILMQMVSDLDPVHCDLMPMEKWKEYLACGSVPMKKGGKVVWLESCGQTVLCPKCAKKAAADMSRNAMDKFFNKVKDGRVWTVTLRLPDGGTLEIMDKRLRACLARLMAMIANHRKPRSKQHASWAIRAIDLWWEVAWGGNRVNPHFHGLLHTEGGESDRDAVAWITSTWNTLAQEVQV